MKRSPFWKTYAAIGVLAALGAYAYFVESKREAKPEKPREKVFNLDKTKVKEVTLRRREGDAVRVVKKGSAWTMTEPMAAPADNEAVDTMVGSLANLEIDSVVLETPSNLADFGLDKPRLTLGVTVEGASEPQKLLIGDKAPDGSSLYAKLPAQARVFAIASYLETSFDKKPFDLRDRDLLHVKREAVKSLEIAGPEGTYTLAKDDRSDWAITKPLTTRAGRWSVDGLVGSIESLRMESVAAEEAEDLKPFGLDKPTRRVVLGIKDGDNRTLEIGSGIPDATNPVKTAPAKATKDQTPAKASKYYAHEAGSRLVAVIPAALPDDLAKGMGELRAKRLLDVATYDVEGFDVEAEGGKRVFARSTTKDKEGVENHKWKRTAPEAKDLDTNAVQDVLFKIGAMEVQDFVDAPAALSSYGIDAPALKVSLRFGGGKAKVWFELGRKSGDAYARRADDAAILKLDAAKAEELIKAFTGL